jgi:hypothetical protein
MLSLPVKYLFFALQFKTHRFFKKKLGGLELKRKVFSISLFSWPRLFAGK